MSAYDLDSRRLYAYEYAERLRRARRPVPRRRRRWLRLWALRELLILSARRRAASLRPSS